MRNKFLTKVLGATLGIAMAIGVGAGVASFVNREAKKLDAADGVTATYTVTSKTAVSASGTRPAGSTASYSQTYNTVSQATYGNSFTLTLSGYAGCTITGLSMSMKSNAKQGAGYMSFVTGSTTMASIGDSENGVAFNDSAWYGAYSSSAVTITPAWAANGTVANNGTIVLTIGCTTNSLYFYSATITYNEAAAGKVVTGITKLSNPTKTEYYQGESFEPAGLVVRVAYNSGDPDDVAYNDHPTDFSWLPETITSAGNVEIQYQNYSSFKVSHAVSLVTPMTVPEAIQAIENAAGNQIQDGYVNGVVSQVDSYSSQYHSITYWISADGTTTHQLQVYGGKGLNGANFASQNDISVGDQVVIRGLLKKHNDTYEFAQNSKILSLTVAPKVNSITLTPSIVTGAPNATGDVDLLFTDIEIDQNENSHKTIGDIDWSSDDENVIYIDGGEYLVTGSHRDSTTIKASIDGVEYGSATFTVIDPSVRVMSYDARVWTIVTDPSTLVAGDKVILTGVKSDVAYAAGTYPGSGNNVPADTSHTLTVTGDNVTGVVDTMIYTLEEGTAEGSVAFKDSSGNYLYAAGASSNNYMKTQDSINANASFILNSNGTVVAQGTGSRNSMRYNNEGSSNLFSCYASNATTGTLVTFYKLSGNAGQIDLPSYNAITTAHEDATESYIRLGVELSESDWNAIDSEIGITGYGVMLIRGTTLATSGFASVEEVFRSTNNNKPTLKDLYRESNAAPQDHFIAARINITLDSNIDVVFRAATYVVSSNGSYCFINEVSGSLYDLI